MPSETPSPSPLLGLDDDPDLQNSASSPVLSEHLQLAQEQQRQQSDSSRRSSSPHPIHEAIGDDLDEADEEERHAGGYPVKRPRTPSSVPPMPVSRKLNVSTKIIKSTESLHVSDIVTFASSSNSSSNNNSSSSSSRNQDRSPLRSSSTTGDQQFCLKWNSYQTNLSKEFDDLLQNESFVDVTLACDGHSVKAHKMVLSACSPYFQALFFDHPCQHPIIIMKEVKWPELKAVVEYMYRGEINVGRDQIEPLLRVANMLKIRGLTDVDQYLNAQGAEEESPLVAKVNRKSPKIDISSSLVREGPGANTPDSVEGYAKKVHEKIRELVDINENVEKSFHQHRDMGADGNRVSSPANSISKMSDSSENKSSAAVASLVRGGGGISVRDRDHLIQPDSPIALTAAVAAAQDRLNRANLATRKRRWMTGSVEGVLGSPLAENHHQLTRSSSSPDNGDNLRESPSSSSSVAVLAMQQKLQQHQLQHQQQLHPHPSLAATSSVSGNMGNMSNSNNNIINERSSSSGSAGAGNSASSGAGAALPFSLPQSTLESMGLSSMGLPAPTSSDDMEIKPGIAEMIREEERAKLLESSHAWLGASTSSIADSYQYQLQSMWQKCWNTNHNMVHQLRFRERGPLKSWRPETMAEAIFSVLKEGLSLSQAARKYDIPYPTFVLYANRVHNMLGPSMDGGTDLRPKGRGRPQRILLGLWPDDHIRGVIKTVVFRDGKDMKEDVGMGYDRQTQAAAMGYPGGLPNGMGPNSIAGAVVAANQQVASESMSNDAAAAAVAAVAHGIRQQMQMVAAAQNYSDAANLVSGLNHLNMYPTNNGGSANNMPMPKIGSPATSGLTISSNLTNSGGSMPHRSAHLQPQQQQQRRSPSAGLNITRINSPSTSIHDLRMQSPDGSSLNSTLEMALEPAVNLAVGVSGFKSGHRQYTHDDLVDLVSGATGRQRLGQSGTNVSGGQGGGGIKMEPVGGVNDN